MARSAKAGHPSGWKPIDPFPFTEAGRQFTGPARDAAAIAIEYFERPDGSLAAFAAFGPQSEGAPGRVHGGAVLTVLDEALGAAAWHAGRRVVTGRLTTEFRRPVSVGARLRVDIRLLAVSGRAVRCAGSLVDDDGGVFASAEGLYVVLRPEDQDRLFGSR